MKIHINRPYSFCLKGQRENQEDARYPDTDRLDMSQQIFVVCDGVGGSEKGEMASLTVCKAFHHALSGTDFLDTELTKDMFRQALDEAYDALDRAAGKDNADMATTMTLVCLHKGGCTMAHIGDSRIYHIRPEEGIMYKSDDHSLVNSMVRSGLLTPEEAINHPQSNVITRYMGPTEDDQTRCMATVTVTTDLQDGDYLIMCTDGVLHCLTDDDLIKICSSEANDSEKAELMARRCVDSTDNSTAMLIPIARVEKETDDEYNSTADYSTTRKITHGMQTTAEIESIQKKSKKGIISYLKRLIR